VKAARRVATAAGLTAIGAAAWEVQRRRDRRAVESDPEWAELLRQPTGATTRQVRAFDGTLLHVEIYGDASAPAIVLAHGWTESIDLWHNQIRDLSRDFRIIAYDQRGHGRSDVPADPSSYTERSLADDLQAVIDACLTPNEPFAAAGHSMGGISVVAWAGTRTLEVARRLVGAALINTGVSELAGHMLVLGPWAGARVHKTAVASPLQRFDRGLPKGLTPLSYRVVRRITMGDRATPGQVAFVHRMIVDCPGPVRAGFGRMFPTMDLRDALAKLTAPTLVVAGERDRLLPPWHAQQIVDLLPNVVEYLEVPGAGHMTPIEAADEVTPRLAALARTPVAAEPRAPVAAPA